MATITPGDLFVPEVVGPIATEILFEKNVLLTSGYVDDGFDRGAYDSGGSTIRFPKFTAAGTLGAQVLPTDTTAVTPDEITMSYTDETVTGKIISYQWTQAALEDALRSANVEQFVARVVATKAGNAVQDALITEAETSTLSYTTDGEGAIGYKSLLEARYDKWGEYANDTTPLLIAHSKVVYDLLCTEEAQKVGVYGVNTVQAGKIMSIAGLNILASDAIGTTTSNGTTVYKNLILKPGALMLAMRRELDYKEQPLAHTDIWNTWWTFRFATHLSEDKPYGVIQYLCSSTLDA